MLRMYWPKAERSLDPERLLESSSGKEGKLLYNPCAVKSWRMSELGSQAAVMRLTEVRSTQTADVVRL